MKKLLVLISVFFVSMLFPPIANAYDQPVTAIITQQMLDDSADKPVVIASDVLTYDLDDPQTRTSNHVTIKLTVLLYSPNEVAYEVWAVSDSYACKFKEGTGFASINVNGDDVAVDEEFGANPLLDVVTLQFGDVYECKDDFRIGDLVRVNLEGHVLTNKWGTYEFDRTFLLTYKG